jgi:hypothetical protein
MMIKLFVLLAAFLPILAFAQPGNVGPQNIGIGQGGINTTISTTQNSSVNGSGNTNLNGAYGNTNIQGAYGNTNIQGAYGNTSVANSGNTDIKGSGNTAIASGNGNTTVIVVAPESK